MKFRNLLLVSLVFILSATCTIEGTIIGLQGYKVVQKADGATGVSGEEFVEDGKPVTVDIEHAKLSETIKNLLEDSPETEKPSIPIKGLNRDQIEFIFSYINEIFIIGKVSGKYTSESFTAEGVININKTRVIEGKETITQEVAGQLKKDKLSVSQLSNLLLGARYLKVNILLPGIVEYFKEFLIALEDLKKFKDKDSEFLALVEAIKNIDLKYQKELSEYLAQKIPPRTLKGHGDGVLSVSFNHDGTSLASGSYDNTIRIWKPSTGYLLRILKGHKDMVVSVSLNHNGTLLASGSDDNMIRIWDPLTGDLIRTLKGHKDRVLSVSFNHDGTLLASGANDNKIRIWDSLTGDLIRTLKGHKDSVWSVSFNHDGTLLASGANDNKIIIWDPLTGDLIRTLKGHKGWVTSVSFNDDGTLLASGSGDSTIRIWNSSTGDLLRILEGHDSLVNSVSFNDDGTLLASGSWDNTIRIWNMDTSFSGMLNFLVE